jgi:hypothetical protein
MSRMRTRHQLFQPARSRSALDVWMEENKKHDYVSICVKADDISRTLKTGAIYPREKDQLCDENKNLVIAQSAAKRIPEIQMSTGGIPVDRALSCKLITLQQYADISMQAPKSIQLNDGKSYPVSHIPGRKKDVSLMNDTSYLQIEGIPHLEMTIDHKIINDVATKSRTDTRSVQLTLNHLSDARVDTALATLWNAYLPLSKDREALAKAMSDLREHRISGGRDNSHLEATYNLTRLEDEKDIHVLYGNPLQTISNIQDSEEKVSLLHPFENNGQYFFWNLSSRNIIVIGSYAALRPYMREFGEKNISVYFTELLTSEQRDFLTTPTPSRTCVLM